MLDEQFKKLQAGRVTAPFETDVAKLNTSYIGGLDRKIAEEKKAGHLDGVLALEAEKQAVGRVFNSSSASPNDLKTRSTMPIPSAEDDATSTTTPAVLKGLRQIYRDAYAKLETSRAANLEALTDPLTVRLKTLEPDLTKKDRIADAQTVKAYREGLGNAGVPPASVEGVSPETPSDLPGDFTDGYLTTAPVMSFKPNKLGIYDLGGNVWEWREDWFDETHEKRVQRGASWLQGISNSMRSDVRASYVPDKFYDRGFRIVVEMTAP